MNTIRKQGGSSCHCRGRPVKHSYHNKGQLLKIGVEMNSSSKNKQTNATNGIQHDQLERKSAWCSFFYWWQTDRWQTDESRHDHAILNTSYLFLNMWYLFFEKLYMVINSTCQSSIFQVIMFIAKVYCSQ